MRIPDGTSFVKLLVLQTDLDIGLLEGLCECIDFATVFGLASLEVFPALLTSQQVRLAGRTIDSLELGVFDVHVVESGTHLDNLSLQLLHIIVKVDSQIFENAKYRPVFLRRQFDICKRIDALSDAALKAMLQLVAEGRL